MPKEEKRLAALERAVQTHEARLEALEARLDPKTREAAFTAVLEDLLDELAGQTGKEDK